MNHHLSLLTEPSIRPERLPVSAQLQKGRWRGSAWGISCVVHGMVLLLALRGGARVPETPPPPVRLVFTEPPPPPPAPSSAIVVETTTPQPSPTIIEKPKIEQPKPAVVKPKPKEVERLKIVKKPNKLETTVPRPQPPVETAPEQEPPPMANATVANGVIGGVSGGVAGGIIGAHGTEALPVSQVANPPLLLSRVMPEYPRSARLQGVEGLVLLEAILALDGHVEDDIKVLQSIPSLDLAAMQALRRWRFRPARDQENRPVRVILEVPVRFVLR